jgi:hypothetical protein
MMTAKLTGVRTRDVIVRPAEALVRDWWRVVSVALEIEIVYRFRRLVAKELLVAAVPVRSVDSADSRSRG